jgi:hypothetical protein
MVCSNGILLFLLLFEVAHFLSSESKSELLLVHVVGLD